MAARRRKDPYATKVFALGATKRCFTTWYAMNRRCDDPRNSNFIHYGARGIRVCARWSRSNLRGFANFYRDMGNPPEGMSLDRKDNDKGYSKSNCAWATNAHQIRNRRKIGALGTFTVDELAKHVAELPDEAVLVIFRQLLRRRR